LTDSDKIHVSDVARSRLQTWLGIAAFGLVESSPAVIIGAMLISPLMGPIMGTGLALAVGASIPGNQGRTQSSCQRHGLHRVFGFLGLAVAISFRHG
jgi:hypothetical protein